MAAFGDVLVQLTLNRPGRKVHVVLGPDARGDHHRPGLAADQQLPADADHALPDHRRSSATRSGRGSACSRTSEFLMKDAYSFDASVESLGRSYEKMYAAYCRIFDRCGLSYLAVEAESGPIGGDASHEFMVPAENGEDTVLHCAACGYAANQEKAEIGARDLHAARRAAGAAPPGGHAGREHDRAGQPVPEVPAAGPHQDADLSGRRPADRRPGPRRPRGERGQDPPGVYSRTGTAALGRRSRSSNWPRRK